MRLKKYRLALDKYHKRKINVFFITMRMNLCSLGVKSNLKHFAFVDIFYYYWSILDRVKRDKEIMC